MSTDAADRLRAICLALPAATEITSYASGREPANSNHPPTSRTTGIWPPEPIILLNQWSAGLNS
jgi:hypothetical protein